VQPSAPPARQQCFTLFVTFINRIWNDLRLDAPMQSVGPAIAALLVLVVTGPAYAACPAANQYNFSFASQSTATLAYGTSYNYTGTTSGGASQSFSVLSTQNGLSSTSVGGEVRPNISSSHDGGTGNNALVIGGILSARTADITSATRVMVTTFTFAVPVRDVTFTVYDVDFGANQFRDWVMIRGFNGAATYTGSHTTPFGTNNGSGPYSNASSSLNLGPVSTPFTITAQQAVGTGVSDNAANTGTITASFAQPVTSVQIRYGNYPYTSGENTTGQQAYGIGGISWCPMPSLSFAKTSAPWSDPQNGTANPKLIPGGDLLYTLTVTNSNSSPVDLATAVLTDALPGNVTFYNGDIDDGGALTTNFAFNAGSSGLTFAAANLTYSNNGGTSYAYSPTAGYDTNVNALRFAPQGTMAANSSFSIQFRARIR
jgi:uncharacterized repeat protein (TIGR01451 family)